MSHSRNRIVSLLIIPSSNRNELQNSNISQGNILSLKRMQRKKNEKEEEEMEGRRILAYRKHRDKAK